MPTLGRTEVQAIWARINRRMAELDMTQADLCRKSGLTHGCIRHYMTGKYAPTAYSIILLCRALSMTSDHLLGLDEIELPPPRYNPPKETP